MKKLSKIFVSLLMIIVAFSVCFSFSGCKEIKTVEITVSVYDIEKGEFADKTLSVELYRHLAPNTVDTILKYAEEGYYDDTVFYKNNSYSKQIMVGNFKFDNGIIENDLKPTIEGEFEIGGTVGNNLKNAEGSLGLWRTWKYDASYTATATVDTGRSTLYMPTSSISAYDGNFCIFAQFDTSSEAWTSIKALFNNSAFYDTYVIFYTGEYNNDDSVLNNGLTFNAMESSEFSSASAEITPFDPSSETGAYAGYEKHNIYVPTYNGQIAAYIKSVKVK